VGGRAYGSVMSAWTWRYEALDGSVMSGPQLPTPSFPSQADAESWVGESWRDLTAAGVESVTLLRDGEVVYGQMSLRPME
jgi:hypothetical protein